MRRVAKFLEECATSIETSERSGAGQRLQPSIGLLESAREQHRLEDEEEEAEARSANESEQEEDDDDCPLPPPLPSIIYGNQSIEQSEQEFWENYRGIREILEAEEHSAANNDENFVTGMKRYQDIKKLLDKLVFPGKDFATRRSVAQVMLHDLCLLTLLPIIFGTCYERNKHKLMQELKIDEIKEFLKVHLPRRFGKTNAFAVLFVAILMIVPNVPVLIASKQWELAVITIDIMTKVIQESPDARSKPWVVNSGYIRYNHPNGQKSQCIALTNSPDAARGRRGMVMFFDEFNYVPEDLFGVMLGGANELPSVMLGASTDSADSFVNDIEHAQVLGKVVFKTVRIRRVCDDCMTHLPPDEWIKCKHMIFMFPPWKDEQRQKELSALAEAAGQGAKDKEDSYGVFSMKGRLFPEHAVMRLFGYENFVPIVDDTRPRFLTMGIDTCAGGDSDLSMVVIAHFATLKPLVVAIGVFETLVDALTQFKEFARMFLGDVRKMWCTPTRNDDREHIPLIIQCENNLMGFSKTLFLIKEDMPDVKMLAMKSKKNTEKSIGVTVTEESKKIMVGMGLLVLMCGQLSVYKDVMIRTNKMMVIKGRAFKDVKDYVLTLAKHEFLNLSRKDGKISGKSRGLQDDLVMALLHSIYCHNLMNSEEYFLM